jgi:hypothetical protein
MPDNVKKDQELVPGGDIRRKGNMWLRKAWEKCKATRVPREAELRKVVRQLAHRQKWCILIAWLMQTPVV